MKEEVILFGASRLGIDAYNNLKDKYNIINFVDNDKNKWNKKLVDNIKIIDINEVLDKKDDAFIIISSMYYFQIYKQLVELGFKNIGNYRMDKEDVEIFLNKNVSKTKNKIKIAMLKVNNSGSNVYLSYKKMPEYIKEKYDIVLLDEKDKGDNYNNDLLSSDVIIYGHGNDFLDDKINIYLSHGTPMKYFGYMSNDYEENLALVAMGWDKVDLYMTTSHMAMVLTNSCIGINKDKYRITGMPRNDMLFSDKIKDIENIDILEKIKNASKTIVYMPTFRNIKTYKDKLNNIYDIDKIEELEDYLSKNNYLLLVKYHPIEYEYLKNKKEDDINKNNSNILYIEDKDFKNLEVDFYEILGITDLLITDYSSVSYDYLLIDKPILYYTPDLEEYRKKNGLLLEPYEMFLPGPIADDIKKVEEEIEKLLNDKEYYASERERAKKILYKYPDDNSTDRVWKEIDKYIESKLI